VRPTSAIEDQAKADGARRRLIAVTAFVRSVSSGDPSTTIFSYGPHRPPGARLNSLPRYTTKTLHDSVGVLGNHDYESGHSETIKGILHQAGVRILDGQSREIEGVILYWC
jgi:hypothetical protein